MPPTALAGMSGVGTLVISMRSMLAVLEAVKPAPRDWGTSLESSTPSTVSSVPLPGMPRIEASPGTAGDIATWMPGTNFRNSPGLPSPRSPNSSNAITFLMLGAVRCSCSAADCALSSRSATVNASSITA